MTPDPEETTPYRNGATPADSPASPPETDKTVNGAGTGSAKPSLLQSRESARSTTPPRPPREPVTDRSRASTPPPAAPRPAPEQPNPQRAAQPLTYAPPSDASLLRNPYVLAGTAIAGAIVLAVMVVIFFGSRGGGGDAATNEDRRSNTPSAGAGVGAGTPTALPVKGVEVRSIAAATVRTGPELDYGEIGPLRSGQDITVVGRNANSTWFQIQFPPGTSFTGWVPATALRVPENSLASIPLSESTPIPRPTIIIPTSTPEPIVTRPPTLTPTVTPTPGTPTPAPPAPGSDLSAQAVAGSCAVGSRLRVSVTNTGPAPVEGKPLAVLTQNAQGVQRSIVSQVVSLAVGGSTIIDTGYTVEERVVVVIDPLGTVGDPNAGNNRVDCVVGAVATATPRTATSTPAAPIATPPPLATATPNTLAPPPIATPTP